MDCSGPLRATRLEIDSCELLFETDRPQALERLEDMCRTTFTGGYYSCSLNLPEREYRPPALRYLDRGAYRTGYEPREEVLTFEAPWTDIAGTELLAVWLHFLSELVRQRRGEYVLHASAVARAGRAIVLFGPGESGKTICALDLCLRHQFQLFANNRIRAAVREGSVRLVKGDGRLNLRLSSLSQYSESLCGRVFTGPPEAAPPWQRKQVIDPGSVGIEVARPAPEVAAFVWIKLDADHRNASMRIMSPEASSHDAFWAKADLYQEISSLIRGVKFIPVVEGRGFREIFVPSLDTPEFVARRVEFLNVLFATARAARIRAALGPSVDAILRLFETVSSPMQP